MGTAFMLILLYFAERVSCIYNDFATTEDIGSY